jgi:hypothetical protein
MAAKDEYLPDYEYDLDEHEEDKNNQAGGNK